MAIINTEVAPKLVRHTNLSDFAVKPRKQTKESNASLEELEGVVGARDLASDYSVASSRRESRDWALEPVSADKLKGMKERSTARLMNSSSFARSFESSIIIAPQDRPEELNPKGGRIPILFQDSQKVVSSCCFSFLKRSHTRKSTDISEKLNLLEIS